MKTQLIALLLLLSCASFAREYDFHWEIGKKSSAQIKAEALAPELEEAATDILTSSFRIMKRDLVLEKVLNGEIRAADFTFDEVQFIYSRSLYLSSVIRNETNNTKLLKEFEELMKPFSKYNELHIKVRQFFGECKDCTQEEVDANLQEILADFDADKLMLDLENVKKSIVSFRLRILNSIQSKK